MRIFGFPVELVIFDVDGVIVDILAGLRKNLESAASYFNLPLEPIAINLEEIRQGKTRIKGNSYDSTRDVWPHLTETEITEFVHHFCSIEQRCPYALIDGALDVIMLLRNNHIPLALATNNPMKSLLWRLEAAGIDPSWFVAITTKDHTYFKPHPKTFDCIFEQINVARERALYIGDLQIDWDMARGAGVLFCAVLTGGVPRGAFLAEGVPPICILNKLSDILKFVDISDNALLCS